MGGFGGLARVTRWAIRLEFDGSRFCGWQRQANAPSIQAALEKALSQVADTPVAVAASGRTDAGVHALGLIAHFDAPVERPAKAWMQGVNRHLPLGAAVTAARPVAEEFHARRSALARTYLYRVLARAASPGLEQGRVAWVPLGLDSEAMAEGARHLLGEHDFSAFRASGCQASSPVQEVQRIAIWCQGDEVRVAVRATAFLYNMVRIIVGSLLEVGKGRQAPDWVASVRASKDREQAGPTGRPEGLYFAAVHYPTGLGAPLPPQWSPVGFDPRAF